MTDPPPSPHLTLADKQTYRKWARGPRLREAHSDDRRLVLEAARPESKLLVRRRNPRLQVHLAGLRFVLIVMKRKKKKKEAKKEKNDEKSAHT